MINFTVSPIKLAVFLLAVIIINPVSVYAISKCQDAAGKWHYGDNAASSCGDAKITIIDKKGRTVEEIGPPLTNEELLAKETEDKRLELEAQQEAKRELEKKRILNIYPDEESIFRDRDSRLIGMDKNIKFQTALLDGMRLDLKELESRKIPANKKEKVELEDRKKDLQSNIDEYNQVIRHLRRDREKTAEKYKRILNEYRELTTEVPEKN